MIISLMQNFMITLLIYIHSLKMRYRN